MRATPKANTAACTRRRRSSSTGTGSWPGAAGASGILAAVARLRGYAYLEFKQEGTQMIFIHQDTSIGPLLIAGDEQAVHAIRFPDGSVSLYIDEEYAIERGVDPATLTRVEIPREMFVNGTIQEIREYVAIYLESRHSGTA